MARFDGQAQVAAPGIPSFHHSEFRRDDLLAAKRGARVVVCIPARDEERTIGRIVRSIGEAEAGPSQLVDEILVVDDRSSDATASEARRNGAVVEVGPGLGKGEAMRLARGRGDLVLYLDGDVEDFDAFYVTGLLGPLLTDEACVMVKGCYARPVGPDGSGGGRVTELVAKPLLSLLFPELEGISQPLAGETALRADVLDKLELTGGYGVEIGLLVDVARLWGPSALAQVDLGQRHHRNRPLSELAPQARDVMAAALTRSRLPEQFELRLP